MEYLNFTVDSALLRELGEKLVESVHLALAELIKNSYAADATEVTVRFTQEDNGNENRISSLYGRPSTGEIGNRQVLLSKIGGWIETHHRGSRNRGELDKI
jgi:hypothetical protein